MVLAIRVYKKLRKALKDDGALLFGYVPMACDRRIVGPLTHQRQAISREPKTKHSANYNRYILSSMSASLNTISVRGILVCG